MKNYKILALFLGILMLSILPVNNVTATMSGGNAVVKSGSLTIKVRYDATGTIYAKCASFSKQLNGPHLNIEVWEGNKQRRNFHVVWEGNCIIAVDSSVNFCKKVCFEKQGKGDMDSVLKILDYMPNSARKSIVNDADATRQYKRLNLDSNPNPGLFYSPQLGGYIAAATAFAAILIAAAVTGLSIIAIGVTGVAS